MAYNKYIGSGAPVLWLQKLDLWNWEAGPRGA